MAAAKAQAGVDTDMAEASTSKAVAGKGSGPTAQQLIAVKAAIANASTLEEIQRLESALVSGSLPSEFKDGGDPMVVG